MQVMTNPSVNTCKDRLRRDKMGGGRRSPQLDAALLLQMQWTGITGTDSCWRERTYGISIHHFTKEVNALLRVWLYIRKVVPVDFCPSAMSKLRFSLRRG